MAYTWSSCVELSIHRMLMRIAEDLGLTIYGGDNTDTYAHSPAPSYTYLTIDEAYFDWYKLRTGRDVNCLHVFLVYYCL